MREEHYDHFAELADWSLQRQCTTIRNHAPFRLFRLSALAGALVGLGVLVILTINKGALVSGLLFPLALTLVVFTNSILFTGSSAALQSRDLSYSSKIFLWTFIFLGNLCGAALLVGTYLLGGYGAPAGLQEAVEARLALSSNALVFRGILCNILVCLGLGLSGVAKDGIMKVIFCWLCIAPFVFLGFEHCVADMTLTLLGAAFGYCTGTQAIAILVYTTIGNFIGGAFIYAYFIKMLNK